MQAVHHLEIRWIALAAVTGAIMGDNFGYLLGHHFGYSILKKHGKKVGLTDERLMLGRYLFRKHGGIVVFLGRFVAVLRVFVALLAGANRMPWHSFLFSTRWAVSSGLEAMPSSPMNSVSRSKRSLDRLELLWPS